MSELPAYLAARLEAAYGAEGLARITAGFAAERKTSLRANALRADAAEIAAALEEAGLPFRRMDWYPDAFQLDAGAEGAVEQLPAYREGRLYLQGLTAMLPALLLDPQPSENILDMCAAPGGKTTQLLALSGGKAQITACERDAGRCERLRFNLDKQGAGRVNVMNIDATRLDDFFRFDKILLDAPCSGSGTVDLRPGAAPRRMTPDWLGKVCRTQAALLGKAAKLLRSGGLLVYATCSILPEENGEQLDRLCRAGGWEPVPVPESWRGAFATLPGGPAGSLTLCPDADCEGFYVAALRKR